MPNVGERVAGHHDVKHYKTEIVCRWLVAVGVFGVVRYFFITIFSKFKHLYNDFLMCTSNYGK